MKDSRDYHQNEVMTIATVNGSQITLTQPVTYDYVANEYYQVEVGLLSRSIVIQGAEDDSEPTDPDPMNCRDDRADQQWTIYSETSQPCSQTSQLTGYGGHVVIHNNGSGFVQGIELYRMGQTNMLGKYPMHFHLLGESCQGCYFRESSIHHSFYRCVSIHGTNGLSIEENVAYDVTGFCYYLEDGVEQENTISYNLAAHVHPIGEIPWGNAQETNSIYQSSENLILPADVTASGFYITNVYNTLVGNAASGGWSGFAFPSLATPLQTFRYDKFRPSNAPTLEIRGNSAHSTGWWWYHAGAFYFGGALYYNDNNVLEYNPGRSFDFSRDSRGPCLVNQCAEPYNDCNSWGCPEQYRTSAILTDNQAFLTAGVGLNSWTGPMEIHGFECHDCRLAMEALSDGFWAENVLAVCRTGEKLRMPTAVANRLEASGFYWYDTGQSHIITQSTFRNCGIRAPEFAQYDDSETRGCANAGDSNDHGCSDSSTVFGFLTHSDEFNPEVMQATRDITFDDCGRRFRFTVDNKSSVSGRLQNWLDVDGSVSGLNEPTLIGSGMEGARDWWAIEESVVHDEQGPLVFIRKNNGPERAVAHMRLAWDKTLHNQVGKGICGNGDGTPCEALGYIRHVGEKFSSSSGLPLTASQDVVGLSGGFGWWLDFNKPAPRSLSFNQLEIDPSSVLLVSIPYPKGTSFEVTAHASQWCSEDSTHHCQLAFSQVDSVDQVRTGPGNTYHVDSDGVLTVRVSAMPQYAVGSPDWSIPDWKTPGRYDSPALRRFERDGVLLPESTDSSLRIQASCPSDTDSSPGDGYCSESVKSEYMPTVCSAGYEQVSYDKCCSTSSDDCIFADKSTGSSGDGGGGGDGGEDKDCQRSNGLFFGGGKCK